MYKTGRDLLLLNIEYTWYMNDSVAISVVHNINFWKTARDKKVQLHEWQQFHLVTSPVWQTHTFQTN